MRQLIGRNRHVVPHPSRAPTRYSIQSGPTEARSPDRTSATRSARVEAVGLAAICSCCSASLESVGLANRYLFASSVIMSRVRGNPSSRASDRLLCENRGSKISHVRTGSWVARLATSDLSKTAIKTHLIRIQIHEPTTLAATYYYSFVLFLISTVSPQPTNPSV